MTVNNRFGILLAEKSMIERRRIPISEVAEKTGITWKTLQQWANNTVTRYDASVINALCRYFSCQVGDLLVYETTGK